jgi:hypothetical protein
MSALGDAMEALESAAGALFPTWNRYRGARLLVTAPALIIGLPTAITYNAGPAGRALYDVPITGAVDVGRAGDLVPFLSADGLAEALQGSRTTGWWGDLEVTEGGSRGLVPNGDGTVVVADVTVRFYA